MNDATPDDDDDDDDEEQEEEEEEPMRAVGRALSSATLMLFSYPGKWWRVDQMVGEWCVNGWTVRSVGRWVGGSADR